MTDTTTAPMNEERVALFGAVYRIELERAVREYPAEYVWPVEDVPVVAGKMLEAVRGHAFNKDGRALKATCKAFGIKHTYRAIYAWLEGEGSTDDRRRRNHDHDEPGVPRRHRHGEADPEGAARGVPG